MLYTWEQFFKEENKKEYFKELIKKVKKEYEENIVYPPFDLMFNAYKLTPFNNVKVIIIGQDPYHNPHQAMGLAFSVPEDVKIPPSLVNIYKEISREYNVTLNQNGDLTYLAKQGVFLLNSLLSVRENEPMSHKDFGYDTLIKNTIIALDKDDTPKVFILWGGNAKKSMKYIKNPNHLVLTSSHPSPLSAYNGFFGNDHFIKTNEFLKSNDREIINWIKK